MVKRFAEAGEALFLRQDPEAALLPLSPVLDAMAGQIYSRKGRSAYKQFIHDRMEVITRVAFGGIAILNAFFAIGPLVDEKGKTIKPDKVDKDGVALYSLEQVLYHVVRCGLLHKAEISPMLRDTGCRGSIFISGNAVNIPLQKITTGLLFAILTEPAFGADLRGTVFERTQWLGVPLWQLVGQREKVLRMVRDRRSAT